MRPNILNTEKIQWLKNQGLKPNDRIAIQKKIDPDWIDLFFGAMKLELNLAPLPLKGPIDSLLNQIKPKLWIDPDGICHHFDEYKMDISSPSLLLSTSGSSNAPKIAVLPFEKLLKSSKSVVEALKIDENDCLLLSLPMHHVGGIGSLLRAFVSGAKVAFEESNPLITLLSLVPTQLYRAWPIHKNLRAILLGGAPITEIPNELPIYATYGLTEMGSSVLLKKQPTKINGYWHLGFPLKHAKIKLSEENEILVQGSSLFEGYLENGKVTKQEGWFSTKDLAHFDLNEGYAIVGRKDNLFISGGENIQPEEIERHILNHPDIIDAIVIPKKDPEFGMRPVACIQSIRPITLKELQFFLQKSLPKFKIPIRLLELQKNGLKAQRKQIFEEVNPSI